MKPILILFIFVPILAFILLGLNILFSSNKPDESKISAYECGYLAVPDQTRQTFQIHFYLVAMLFLVFDLELILIFPLAITLSTISTYGFAIGLVFFLILTIGFILEIGSGVISI
jgi:NADH-ubiquinone oxidoreductase chain 3